MELITFNSFEEQLELTQYYESNGYTIDRISFQEPCHMVVFKSDTPLLEKRVSDVEQTLNLIILGEL